MGARFAPGVAQVLTWLIVYEIPKTFPGVTVVTVLGNIRLSSDNLSSLRKAYTEISVGGKGGNRSQLPHLSCHLPHEVSRRAHHEA